MNPFPVDPAPWTRSARVVQVMTPTRGVVAPSD